MGRTHRFLESCTFFWCEGVCFGYDRNYIHLVGRECVRACVCEREREREREREIEIEIGK